MIRKLEASHDNVIGYSAGGDVTDDTVTEWLTKLGGTVSSVEVQHFDTAEEDKAWAWLE